MLRFRVAAPFIRQVFMPRFFAHLAIAKHIAAHFPLFTRFIQGKWEIELDREQGDFLFSCESSVFREQKIDLSLNLPRCLQDQGLAGSRGTTHPPRSAAQ